MTNTSFLSTGIGSLPGVSSKEATSIIVGELDIPHVAELPGRGPGSDLIGRTLGMLANVAADFGADTTVDGWRFSDAPGRVMRRASSWLDEDLDQIEEKLQGFSGELKVSVCGPWTLAAEVELRNGERALRDPGACRELTSVVTEAALHLVERVAHRVPGATVLLQVDEPSINRVLSGGVRTASGLSAYPPIDRATVGSAISSMVAAVPNLVVHTCVDRPPMSLFTTAGVRGLSIDVTGACDLDAIAEFIDGGAVLYAGAVPTTGGSSAGALTDSAVRRVAGLLNRIGFGGQVVSDRVRITPTCGLAGASPDVVRMVYESVTRVGRMLQDEDEQEVDGDRR